MVRDSETTEQGPGCLGYVFFGLFALGGTVAAFATFLWPMWMIFQAQSWEPKTCIVQSSSVEVSSSSDGDTYRIYIQYTFEHAGTWHQGDRYDFSVGSSSGYDGKQRVVDQHPEGAEVICFVDPDDPSRSVIQRGAGTFLLWGLISLPFLLIGFGGLIFFRLRPQKARKAVRLASPRAHARPSADPMGYRPSGRPGRTNDAAPMPDSGPGSSLVESATMRHLFAGRTGRVNEDASGMPDSVEYPADPNGRLVLRTQQAGAGMALVVAFFGVIWLAIMMFTVVPDMWTPPAEAEPFDWLMNLAVTPFVLVGVAALVMSGYMFLASTNPKPKLVLDRARPVLGESLRVAWTFTGNVSKIRRLTLTLQGQETAVYQRGTNTVTDRHMFYERELLATEKVETRGSLNFEVPAHLLPSFLSLNNRVDWQLVIHGDIPRWPDVKLILPFPIYPPPVAESDEEAVDTGAPS